MSDDRLEALEQGEQARRAEMVTEAAQRAGWHDPSLAPRLLDLATIASPQAAGAAVRTYSAQNSYMVQQPLTQQGLERQWEPRCSPASSGAAGSVASVAANRGDRGRPPARAVGGGCCRPCVATGWRGGRAATARAASPGRWCRSTASLGR